MSYWLDFQVSCDIDCECLSSEQLCLFMLCFTFVFGLMIYIIVLYLSCLNASSQDGKGHYQQMTLLKVDVLNAGQTLAISYWYRQSRGQLPPSLSYAQLPRTSASEPLELSLSVLGRTWHGHL